MFFVHFKINEEEFSCVHAGKNKSCIVMLSNSEGIQHNKKEVL